MGIPSGSVVKNLPSLQEMWVQTLGREDALKNPCMLAWKIHWTEDGIHGRLQSKGLQNLTTKPPPPLPSCTGTQTVLSEMMYIFLNKDCRYTIMRVEVHHSPHTIIADHNLSFCTSWQFIFLTSWETLLKYLNKLEDNYVAMKITKSHLKCRILDLTKILEWGISCAFFRETQK